MMTKTVKYALKEKASEKILGYIVSSNEGGEFCVENQYTLYAGDEPVWYADETWRAEYVRQHSTEWYNADYETPTHHYEPEELEVVKVTIVVEEEPVEVKIPTKEEYWKWQYGDREPGHLKYLLERNKTGEVEGPGIYELTEYMRAQEKAKAKK